MIVRLSDGLERLPPMQIFAGTRCHAVIWLRTRALHAVRALKVAAEACKHVLTVGRAGICGVFCCLLRRDRLS